ncbi:MAG: T9SS type A sorting domain-containing protein, partial [candidate division Zixibacteria bacterium]|nr:T9SS type A sorting domain-containing protein [candidate division Zixibacteria bacterium]
NVLGQEIRRVDRSYGAGSHVMRVDLDQYPSGVYLYRLQANDQTATGKMVLLK